MSQGRIAVTGGRDHWPTAEEHAAFLEVWEHFSGEVLLHGAYPTGVDAYYNAWAWTMQRTSVTPIQVKRYPTDWRLLGKKAGPLRSARMVADADILVALPGGRGTQGCIEAALRSGMAESELAARHLAVRVFARETPRKRRDLEAENRELRRRVADLEDEVAVLREQQEAEEWPLSGLAGM